MQHRIPRPEAPVRGAPAEYSPAAVLFSVGLNDQRSASRVSFEAAAALPLEMLPLRSFRAAGSGAWAARGAGWAASPLCAPLRAAPPSPAAAAATLRTAARLVHSGVLRARSGGRAPVALSLPRSCGGARSSLARSPLRVFLRRNASKEGAEKSAPPRRLCRPPVCASQPPA